MNSTDKITIVLTRHEAMVVSNAALSQAIRYRKSGNNIANKVSERVMALTAADELEDAAKKIKKVMAKS